MGEKKKVISRKRVVVSRERDRVCRLLSGPFVASYPGVAGYRWAATADAAGEEVVRMLVIAGWVDPRPASKGGAR